MQSPTPRSRAPACLRAAIPAIVFALFAVLAGCASGPLRSTQRDGPEANPPPDLARVPNAEPKLESIRSGGPNKPYEVLGKSYTPITKDTPYTERGMASWYGRAFQGKRTASGEVYNMYAMTAAHPTLPIPSYARIRNPANGREVVVRINDRGPFHSGRIVDLSYTAALKLDLLRGVAPVELQRITFEEIRTGAWRREGDAATMASDAPNAKTASVPVATALVQPVAATAGASAPTPPMPAAPAAALATAPATAPATTPATAPATAPATVADSAPAATPIPAANDSGTPAAAAGDRAAQAPQVAPAGAPTTAPIVDAPAAAPIVDAPVARAFTAPARGFWVQLGAFRLRQGAEGFQKRVSAELDWLSPLLAVFNDASMFRLQAGPYPTRDEARSVAERVRSNLQLVPVIVERR
jgi:rare lipoprotein A